MAASTSLAKKFTSISVAWRLYLLKNLDKDVERRTTVVIPQKLKIASKRAEA